jgi:hypothetical protein
MPIILILILILMYIPLENLKFFLIPIYSTSVLILLHFVLVRDYI